MLHACGEIIQPYDRLNAHILPILSYTGVPFFLGGGGVFRGECMEDINMIISLKSGCSILCLKIR